MMICETYNMYIYVRTYVVRMYVCMYVCMYECKLCIVVLPSTVQYFTISVTAHAIYMFANMLPSQMYRYKRSVFRKRRRYYLNSGIEISV